MGKYFQHFLKAVNLIQLPVRLRKWPSLIFVDPRQPDLTGGEQTGR